MQRQILGEYQSEQLRVYAIWQPMLGGDSREDWNGTIMPDARVMHLWDGELIAGQWFAREIDGFEGISWDVYYLFGPDATWETVPSPLIGTGRTIYGEREMLKRQFGTLMDAVP